MKKAFSLIMMLALTASCFAADIRPGGGITAVAGCGSLDDPVWSELLVRAEGEISVYGDFVEFFFQGDLLYDHLDQDYPVFTAGEIWVEWETPFGYWMVGRQRISWGQGLAFPVLDVICPTDYSLAFSGEDSDSALPVTALHWTWSGGPAIVEAVWIPVFTSSRLPDGPIPGIPAGAVVLDAEEPDFKPQDGEWGARCRFFLPFADLGAVVYYGWDDLPVTTVDITMVGTEFVPRISPSHERLFVTGADAAIPLGAFLFRVETGVYWNRAFSVEDPGEDLHYSHQGALLMGVDWMPSDWRFTLEATGTLIFTDSDSMIDSRENIVLAGEISRSFSYGKWEAVLSGFWNISDEDWYLNPEIICSPADGLEIALGAQIIQGDDSIFAFYDDDVIVYSRVKYLF